MICLTEKSEQAAGGLFGVFPAAERGKAEIALAARAEARAGRTDDRRLFAAYRLFRLTTAPLCDINIV